MMQWEGSNLSRSTEVSGQLPALKKAAVSVMEKHRSLGLRGSVYIVHTSLHSQEAMDGALFSWEKALFL